MKKFLSLALSVLMLLSLAACKGAGGGDAEDTGAATAETAASEEEVAENAGVEEDRARPGTKGILRYGADAPFDVPEFDTAFYAQPVDAFTDDVLAANRAKLDMVPAGVTTETLNRFTEYLNLSEPGEKNGVVQRVWVYGSVFAGEDCTEIYELMQIPVPVFKGGELQYSFFSFPGPQAPTVRNPASVEDMSAADGIWVEAQVVSYPFNSADFMLENYEEAYTEGPDEVIYSDYDEDEKTGVFSVRAADSEDSLLGSVTDTFVYQTIAEGCGYDFGDVMLQLMVEVSNEPELSDKDLEELRSYFEYIGVKFPDDAVWTK